MSGHSTVGYLVQMHDGTHLLFNDIILAQRQAESSGFEVEPVCRTLELVAAKLLIRHLQVRVFNLEQSLFQTEPV
jgi:hypothetical protein